MMLGPGLAAVAPRPVGELGELGKLSDRCSAVSDREDKDGDATSSSIILDEDEDDIGIDSGIDEP